MQGTTNEILDHDVPQGRQGNWRDYARILWERKWTAITTLVIVATFQLIANFKAVPIYTASAKIELGAEAAKILNFANVETTGEGGAEYVNTQLRILQSRSLADKVVKSLALDQNRDFMPGVDEHEDFAEAVQKCLSVQQIRGTRLVEIAASHKNPSTAALIANGVAHEFIKQNIDRKMNTSLDAVRWLGEQSIEYKAKLEQSEAAVQEYREKSGFYALEESQKIMSDKVGELSIALAKAKTDVLESETAWNQAKALMDAGQSPVAVPAVAASPEVAAWRAQLTQKQISISVLRERYKDKYPAMVVALKEQKEIEEALNKACAAAVARLKDVRTVAKAREAELERVLTEHQKQALELSRKQLSFSILKRNSDSDRQLYDTIITRMKEAGITGKFELNNIRILDLARPPTDPSNAGRLQNLLKALVLGLLAGLGLSYGAHLYDGRLRNQADISAHVGLPLLCEVPRIELADEKQRAAIIQIEPRSLAAEAFRSLRATLKTLPSSKKCHVLLVTSTAPGEGKSLVASNLAVAFARDNLRTLLIDADLRRPSIFKGFALTGKTDFVQYLTNGAKPEDVICKTEVPNLDVVVTGETPQNPAELLGSAKMRELLDSASKRYDRVIIDSSPVAVVSDPIVMLPCVQGVVFVTQFKKVRRDAVASSVKKLRDSGAPLIGIVLNNIDLGKHGYLFPYRHLDYYRHDEGGSPPEGDGNGNEPQELEPERKA